MKKLGTGKLTKKHIAAQKLYLDGVDAALRSMGAKQVSESRFLGCDLGWIGGCFTLETKAGELDVSPHAGVTFDGGALHTRFRDVARARRVLGGSDALNVHSGKWNHYFFDVSVESAIASARAVLEQVKQ